MASEVRDLVGRVRPFHRLWNIDVSDGSALAEFLGILEEEEPYTIFAEVRDFLDMGAVLDPILTACPRAPVVVYGRAMESQAFVELNRTGIRFFLHLPAKAGELESIFQALRAAPPSSSEPEAPCGKVVSFIPAKPGAGASTAAAHFAHACSEILGKRVALVDLDLNCGVQGVLPRIESKHSLPEIVRRVNRSGSLPAENLMTRAGAVDVFSSDKRTRTARLDCSEFEEFVRCLERAYVLVVIDHSGNWERYSVLGLRRSAAVFYVCGADHLSLRLACSGRPLLDEDAVPNVRLLLNRSECKGAAAPAEAERLVGMPLFASLPNSYSVLQQAARSGGLAPRSSPYGEAVNELCLRTVEWLLMPRHERGGARRGVSSGVLSALGLSTLGRARR